MNLPRVLRALIATEATLGLVGLVAGALLRDSLPEMLQQYLMLHDGPKWTTLDMLYLVVFALLITGWIGLWKLRPWSRRVYTIAQILGLFATPMLGPQVSHGIESMLNELTILTAGVTLGLVWFSPLAVHFGRKLPNPSPQDGPAASGRPLG
jgi:hypothetical protein